MKIIQRNVASGFSLTEMMLVLLLVAMIGSSTLSGWQHYQYVLKLEQTSARLLLFLMSAQAEANWENATYKLLPVKNSGEKWFVNIVPEPINGENKQECLFEHRYCFVSEYPDIELKSFTENAGMAFYGRRGNAAAGHLVLASPAGEIRVILSARGRLRRCSESGVFAGVPKCD